MSVRCLLQILTGVHVRIQEGGSRCQLVRRVCYSCIRVKRESAQQALTAENNQHQCF